MFHSSRESSLGHDGAHRALKILPSGGRCGREHESAEVQDASYAAARLGRDAVGGRWAPTEK